MDEPWLCWKQFFQQLLEDHMFPTPKLRRSRKTWKSVCTEPSGFCWRYHTLQVFSKNSIKTNLLFTKKALQRHKLFMRLDFRHKTAAGWIESVLSQCALHWMTKLTRAGLKNGMCLSRGRHFPCLPSPPLQSSLLCIWTCLCSCQTRNSKFSSLKAKTVATEYGNGFYKGMPMIKSWHFLFPVQMGRIPYWSRIQPSQRDTFGGTSGDPQVFFGRKW